MTPRFSTIPAAERFAITRLGLKQISLGTDLPLAQLVVSGLAAAKARGAYLPPVVRISSKGLQPGDIAYTTPFAKTVLQFHPGAPQLTNPGLLAAEGLGFSGPDAVLIHELGHVGHIRALGIDPYLKMARSKITAAEQTTAAEVSEYAATDRCEFVAETFAGLSAGRTYSPAVFALYLKLRGPAPLAS